MPDPKPSPESTAQEALEAFLLSRQAGNFSAGTLRFYRQKLTPFVTWAGPMLIGDVTADMVRRYLVHLQTRSLSPATIHAAARSIKTFLRFCVEEGLTAKAPRIALPKLPKPILPAFAHDDLRRLIGACGNERDRAAVLLLLDTGVRAGEFVALDVGDVDLSTGTVHVRSGKGAKGRVVYLSPSTRRRLHRYLLERRPPSNAPLFVALRSGQRLTDSGLRQLLERLGKRAKVEHAYPHTFRRTFALESLRGGMNIYALARLMGHSDIAILRPYLNLVDDDLQSAHREADVVARLLK